RSFAVTSSSTRSASSNGSIGRTNQASAPDQLANHLSWRRSRRITMAPGYGSFAPRRSRARANAPIREAISSATTASGRSRQAFLRPSSPSDASMNSNRSPKRRSMLATASRVRVRDSGSGETSRTFPAVTIGVWVGGKIGSARALAYVAAQFAGGIFASLLLRFVVPRAVWKAANLGTPLLATGIGQGKGILIEAVLAFFLVFTFFATL